MVPAQPAPPTRRQAPGLRRRTRSRRGPPRAPWFGPLAARLVQQLEEVDAGACHAGSDGANGAFADLRRLAIGQTEHLSEHERLPAVGLETPQQVGDEGVLAGVVGDGEVTGPRTVRKGSVTATASDPRAQLVHAHVPSDGEQPGPRRGVTPVPRECSNGAKKRLLCQVLGRLPVDERGAEPPYLLVGDADQRLECPLVASPGAGGEAGEVVHADTIGTSPSTGPPRSVEIPVTAGNRPIPTGDYHDMTCDLARRAISARLDGEAGEVGAAEVDAHLLRCDACCDWQRRSHELTRKARLQPSPAPRPAPALLDTVSRAYQAAQPRWSPLTSARAALAVIALGQIAVTIPALILGQDHAAPVHVAHEMGSLDAAVAVGLLVAVRRPARAMGMLTLVGAAALLLVATAIIDLATEHTFLLDEAPHLLVVAGWLLLRRLALLAPPSLDRPRSARQWAGAVTARLAARLASPSVGEEAGSDGPEETAWPSTGEAVGAAGCDSARTVASG